MIPLLNILNTTVLQTIVDSPLEYSPKYFLAIIAGIILAIVFQLILTALSVAIGITAVGDLKEKFVKAQNPSKDQNEIKENNEFDQDYSSGTSMGVKITTAFGLWSVITTCLALFSATAIALHLSLITVTATSMAMALVIWGSFFLILFYLESRFVTTTVGGLISTATSGLRSSIGGITSLFGTSKEKKIEHVVDHSLDKIKKNFENSFNTDKITGTLEKFASKIDQKLPDYETLKSDLETVAKKNKDKNTAGKWMAIQQVLTKAIEKNDQNPSGANKDKIAQAKTLLNRINESYDKEATLKENAGNIVSQFSSKDKEEVQETIDNFLAKISSLSGKDFSSENLQQNLKSYISNPKLVFDQLSNSGDGNNKMTRESILNALDKNTNLKKEELENYADQIEDTLNKAKSKLDPANDDSYIRNFESSIENYFNSTGQEELAYSELKKDFKLMMDNPSDSYDIVKERISQFDTNTLKSVITSIPFVEDSHMSRIEEYFEEAKNKTSEKLSAIETKARQQYEMTKRKAVIKAEQTRRTAASAAWWLVITAVLSALASMGGALMF